MKSTLAILWPSLLKQICSCTQFYFREKLNYARMTYGHGDMIKGTQMTRAWEDVRGPESLDSSKGHGSLWSLDDSRWLTMPQKFWLQKQGLSGFPEGHSWTSPKVTQTWTEALWAMLWAPQRQELGFFPHWIPGTQEMLKNVCSRNRWTVVQILISFSKRPQRDQWICSRSQS